MSLYNYDRRASESDEDPPRTADEGILFESDLKAMAPDERARWKGYTARVLHSVYSKQAWEESEEPSLRQEHAGPFLTLEALVKHLASYKFEAWVDVDQGLIGGKPKKDRKGGATQVDVYVECKNSPRLNSEEREFLTQQLKLPKS